MEEFELCIYCGREGETEDHVPSRIFLDKPYPDTPPKVPACFECNNGFSLDEEYLACLLECVVVGSAAPESMERKRIRETLKRGKLQSRLESSMEVENNQTIGFKIEHERVERIIHKLAIGHVYYEYADAELTSKPVSKFGPLILLSEESWKEFEQGSGLWADLGTMTRVEIGPRKGVKKQLTLERQVLAGDSGWIIVQPGRYRYRVENIEDGYLVRIVLREYLGAEIYLEAKD